MKIMILQQITPPVIAHLSIGDYGWWGITAGGPPVAEYLSPAGLYTPPAAGGWRYEPPLSFGTTMRHTATTGSGKWTDSTSHVYVPGFLVRQEPGTVAGQEHQVFQWDPTTHQLVPCFYTRIPYEGTYGWGSLQSLVNGPSAGTIYVLLEEEWFGNSQMVFYWDGNSSAVDSLDTDPTHFARQADWGSLAVPTFPQALVIAGTPLSGTTFWQGHPRGLILGPDGIYYGLAPGIFYWTPSPGTNKQYEVWGIWRCNSTTQAHGGEHWDTLLSFIANPYDINTPADPNDGRAYGDQSGITGGPWIAPITPVGGSPDYYLITFCRQYSHALGSWDTYGVPGGTVLTYSGGVITFNDLWYLDDQPGDYVFRTGACVHQGPCAQLNGTTYFTTFDGWPGSSPPAVTTTPGTLRLWRWDTNPAIRGGVEVAWYTRMLSDWGAPIVASMCYAAGKILFVMEPASLAGSGSGAGTGSWTGLADIAPEVVWYDLGSNTWGVWPQGPLPAGWTRSALPRLFTAT